MLNAYRPSVVLVGFTMTVLIFLAGFPIAANAHPPKDVQLIYDAASQKLSVTIIHNSITPSMHYIKQVEIKKSGALLSNNQYKSQPDKTSFTYTYNVQAAPGDVVEVTSTCSIYGSKTVKLDIAK